MAVAVKKRRFDLKMTTMNLYLVQAPHRPAMLPALDGIPTFQSAVVAAASGRAARALARGVASRNQWVWVDDEIAVRRLATNSNVSQRRVLSSSSDLN
jgi:hypothetical protein